MTNINEGDVMVYLNGLKIDVSPEVLKSPGMQDLIDTLYNNACRLQMYAPYDCSLTIKVDRTQEANFKAKLHLASKALHIDEESEAKSPYVAAERVFLSARDAVNTWSLTKVV
jgi:hypothetical protein